MKRIFDIHSTKAKQFGFTMQLGNGEKLTCCSDEPYNGADSVRKGSTWLLREKHSVFIRRQTNISHMKNIIRR